MVSWSVLVARADCFPRLAAVVNRITLLPRSLRLIRLLWYCLISSVSVWLLLFLAASYVFFTITIMNVITGRWKEFLNIRD